MEFRLLGPFEARHHGRRIEVGSRRQERCLLGLLLLEPGRILGIDRLADLLWDGDPPTSARGVIHTYVGRLRGTLQPYGLRLATRHDGYLLDAERHHVDATDFRRLARQGAAITEPGERVRVLDTALDLWRGPLLADLADDRLRARLDAELAELRLTSQELRAEALLAADEPGRVVTVLTPLVTEQPTRERLAGQLMTALYRCGRRADALDVYRGARQALVDDLGLDPGIELRSLHQRILRGDPDLTGPTVPAYAVRVRGHYLPWNVGGHPALEFCNTYAGWRHHPPLERGEWLRGYDTLAVWAGHLGLADEDTVTGLLAAAEEEPEQAATVLAEARALRRGLYSYLTGCGDAEGFRGVAELAEAAAKVSAFVPDSDGLGRWKLSPAAGLRLPLYAAARAAADLLADPRRFTVRACPHPECGWLFLDHTGVRKWCSTATCGNPTRRAS